MFDIYKYVAIAAVVGGLMSFSYEKGVDEATKKIAAFQNKEIKEEVKLDDVVVPVLTKIVVQNATDAQQIRDTANTNAVLINNNIMDSFLFSVGWIEAYNATLKKIFIDPNVASNTTPSVFTAKDVLLNHNENSTTCILIR